jgi:hypothetical protein
MTEAEVEAVLAVPLTREDLEYVFSLELSQIKELYGPCGIPQTLSCDSMHMAFLWLYLTGAARYELGADVKLTYLNEYKHDVDIGSVNEHELVCRMTEMIRDPADLGPIMREWAEDLLYSPRMRGRRLELLHYNWNYLPRRVEYRGLLTELKSLRLAGRAELLLSRRLGVEKFMDKLRIMFRRTRRPEHELRRALCHDIELNRQVSAELGVRIPFLPADRPAHIKMLKALRLPRF